MEYPNQIIDGIQLGAQSDFTGYKMEYLSKEQINFVKKCIPILNNPNEDWNAHRDPFAPIRGEGIEHTYVNPYNEEELKEYKANIQKAKD